MKTRALLLTILLAVRLGAASGEEGAPQNAAAIGTATEETPTEPETAQIAETQPLTTSIEAGFSYDAFSPLNGTGRGKNAEKAIVGITARKGNNLTLDGRVEAHFSGDPLIADDLVRELALSWTASPLVVLTAGKQKLKWGTAHVFSSIDSLAKPINPLDPQGSNRGVTGLRADFIPTWWMSLSALAIPDAAYADRSTAAFRAEFLAGETDLSIGGLRSVNADGQEEPAFFADFARFFDRFGIYGEGQISKKDTWKPSLTGGIQVDFPVWLDGTITLLGEYRWQKAAEDAQHMIYAGFSGIPITRKLMLGLSAIAAPQTDQAVLTANLGWKIDQSMDFETRYDYLYDWKTGSDSLIQSFTGYRHHLSSSITAWY